MLSEFGYESRNQSCTLTAVIAMIQEKKIDLNMDLVMQFDTLDAHSSLTSPTVRSSREQSTYGVETSIDIKQLENIKRLSIKMQQETIKIIAK